ncbi:MAG: zinc dependent phospholipase C family protein, partial [Clostridium celatum]|nr:zinc dependent phospholipase C family protein [Clostridium celatum]
NISTHINFLRILKNKYFNELDINFLTLGSIAPNYYVIFNDTNKSCLSHFKEDSSEKCNLTKFRLNLSNKKLNYLEKSFAMGYYTHLWLDNYFDENIERFFISKSNIETYGSHVILNENIKNYDIKLIIDFISKINIIDSSFKDFLPIKLNKSINIFNDFKYKCLNKNFNTDCPIIITENDYIRFINGCSNVFLKEFNSQTIIK